MHKLFISSCVQFNSFYRVCQYRKLYILNTRGENMFSSAIFYERLSALCRANATCITIFARNVLKTSTSAPTNWKNGTVPSAEIIYRCAKELSVSADYLLGLCDSPEPFPQDAFTPQEIALIRRLRQSDPKSREVALASMRAVLSACQSSQDTGAL